MPMTCSAGENKDSAAPRSIVTNSHLRNLKLYDVLKLAFTRALSPAPDATPAVGEVALFVEDDPDVRTYLVESLRELGYQVLEAKDGPAALPMLRIH